MAVIFDTAAAVWHLLGTLNLKIPDFLKLPLEVFCDFLGGSFSSISRPPAR